jgi:hypothetical protein
VSPHVATLFPKKGLSVRLNFITRVRNYHLEATSKTRDVQRFFTAYDLREDGRE